MGDPRPTVYGDYVFQVGISNEQLEERLNLTEPYSRKFAGEGLMNCANLTLTLLGIVSSKDYLSVCTARKKGTPHNETIQFISEALKKCGSRGSVYISGKRPIDELTKFAGGLLPGYATDLSLVHPDRSSGHSVLLRRDKCNQFFLIDAQVGEDGLYPEQAIGMNRILKYLKHDGYAEFRYFGSSRGDYIQESEVHLCTTDRLPETSPAPVPPPVVQPPPVPAPSPYAYYLQTPKPAPDPAVNTPEGRQSFIQSIQALDSEKILDTASKLTTLDYEELGTTPLIQLARRHDSGFPKDRMKIRELLRALVQKGANINYADSMGNTPLIHVVRPSYGPSEDILDIMCKLGANATIKNKDGDNALDIAMKRKLSSNIINILRACPPGAYKPPAPPPVAAPKLGDPKALMEAIKSGDKGTIERYILATQNLNFIAEDGINTPLIALIKRYINEKTPMLLELIQDMLDYKADVNFKTSKGNTTALHEAVKGSNLEVVKLLCKHGADPNLENGFGQSALDLSKNLAITNALRDCGRKKGGKTRRRRMNRRRTYRGRKSD